MANMAAMRRVVLLTLLTFVASALPALAQKTVHVNEYKRKDGTVVKAHDRKAPSPKAATASSTTASNSGATGAVAFTKATTVVILKLKGPLPSPIDGVVNAPLASGATIRLRATDIDYERTATDRTRVVLQPVGFTQMTAGDGRQYMNLTFSSGYAVTAWREDIDYDAMRPPELTRAESTAHGIAMASYSQLADGMAVEQATKILGFAPTEESRAEIAGAKTVLYKWKRDESVIVVVFKDGQLFSKLPFGLQ